MVYECAGVCTHAGMIMCMHMCMYMHMYVCAHTVQDKKNYHDHAYLRVIITQEQLQSCENRELSRGSMKTWLRNYWKPRDLEHLKEGIKLYWSRLTPEVCQRYVGHIQKVLPEVIKCNGGPTGY